jgi:HSP20 family protein
MVLMRFDPFREVDRLANDAWTTLQRRVPFMPIDAYKHDNAYIVHFDLPGVDPSTIELTIEKNVLSLSAKREWDPGEDEVVVAERPQGTFTRQLFLGEGLDSEHVKAEYDKGVLTVTIPIAEAARPRRVEIATSSPKAAAITTEAVAS